MSGSELLVILVAVLLLFGGKKLPELARTWGKVARDIRRTLFQLRKEMGIDLDEPPEDKKKPPEK